MFIDGNRFKKNSSCNILGSLGNKSGNICSFLLNNITSSMSDISSGFFNFLSLFTVLYFFQPRQKA